MTYIVLKALLNSNQPTNLIQGELEHSGQPGLDRVA